VGSEEVGALAAGIDGRVWFVEAAGVGAVDGNGVEEHWSWPTGAVLAGIAAGADGSLWVTNVGMKTVDRLSSGHQITAFIAASLSADDRAGITTDINGNVWFAETTAGSIGELTSAEDVREFPAGHPTQITIGVDGDLWFVDGYAVSKSTVSGAVTTFQLPNASSQATAVAPDGRGYVWVSDAGVDSIWRLSSGGQIVEFPLPDDGLPGPGVYGIAVGPDGSVWFTETAGFAVGRFVPP
jgi:virginiamycin B lyase